MNEERFKLTIYADAKTLEVLDLISDRADIKIDGLASLLLAHSAAKLSSLYRVISAMSLGADQ